jgi:hypothetical protein
MSKTKSKASPKTPTAPKPTTNTPLQARAPRRQYLVSTPDGLDHVVHADSHEFDIGGGVLFSNDDSGGDFVAAFDEFNAVHAEENPAYTAQVASGVPTLEQFNQMVANAKNAGEFIVREGKQVEALEGSVDRLRDSNAALWSAVSDIQIATVVGNEFGKRGATLKHIAKLASDALDQPGQARAE